jgi:hypothetical protein
MSFNQSQEMGFPEITPQRRGETGKKGKGL